MHRLYYLKCDWWLGNFDRISPTCKILILGETTLGGCARLSLYLVILSHRLNPLQLQIVVGEQQRVGLCLLLNLVEFGVGSDEK